MPDSDPTQDFGFLMYEVSRLLRRELDRRLKPLGLTQVQWRALAMLSRREGINQATLAEDLEVRPITLGRLIDRLEGSGWVERRSDPRDRRACRLYLTPQVQPLLTQIRSQAREVRTAALDGLEPEGRTALMNALRGIKQNLSGDACSAPKKGADANAD